MSGWSDYGFPNPQTNNPLLTAQGLIASGNERVDTLNSTGYVIVSATRFTEISVLTPFESYSAQQFAKDFENRLNVVIPYFVNHTYNGGDFTGVQLEDGISIHELFPRWTVDNIYDYLSEDRIDPYSGKFSARFFAKWAQQKYRVINLLRWFVGKYHAIESTQYKRAMGSHNTWASAVSSYNSEEWNTLGLPNLQAYAAFSEGDEYDSYGLEGWRGKIYQINNSELSCAMDIYTAGSVPTGSDTENYYPLLQNLEYYKFLRLETDVSLPAGEEYSSDYYEPEIPPDPSTSPTTIWEGTNEPGGCYDIFKFDVSGGFTFGDWETEES